MYYVKNFHIGQFLRSTRGRPPHSSPSRSPPRSERFKFLSHDKRQGAPVYYVKNFHVGQSSGPTRGDPLFLSP